MKTILVSVFLSASIASGVALAQSDLLRTRGCLACHDRNRTTVGPALKDIGAKYKGDKSKAADIVARMKAGRGHPKVEGSDAELKAAVEAALTTR